MPPMSRFVAVSVVAIAVALLLCKEVARKDVGVRLGWGGGGKAQSSVELLDKKWVDAIPAFGSAMSSDDLSRQIHWLHKHNAAKQKQRRHRAAVSTQPLDLVESDGSALVPENRAAIKYMSSIVENAYDDEAGVVAAKSEGDRDTMQERLKAEVRLAARTTMMEMGRDATVKITPEAIHVLQKALGGAEVAHLCHKLSLPCPITSGKHVVMHITNRHCQRFLPSPTHLLTAFFCLDTQSEMPQRETRSQALAPRRPRQQPHARHPMFRRSSSSSNSSSSQHCRQRRCLARGLRNPTLPGLRRASSRGRTSRTGGSASWKMPRNRSWRMKRTSRSTARGHLASRGGKPGLLRYAVVAGFPAMNVIQCPSGAKRRGVGGRQGFRTS
jgi:hypothetical protein